MYSYEISVKYKIGQLVYLKTDVDSIYIVIGYALRESQVAYILKCGDHEAEYLKTEILDNNLGLSAN